MFGDVAVCATAVCGKSGKSESGTVRLVRTVCKSVQDRGCEKSGKPVYFREFVQMQSEQEGLSVFVCLFVCWISLTSGQLVSEHFPDYTRSCFPQVILCRMGGDRNYEMSCLFVVVGPIARFIVLPHWDNMS